MQSDTQDKRALILGASSGFGAAAARRLAVAGFDIAGVHLDRASGMEAVETLRAEIAEKGREATFFNINAADDARRGEVLDSLGEQVSSGFDLLLHSLAFGTLKPLVTWNDEKPVSRKQLEMTVDVMANSLVYWVRDLIERGMLREGARVLALTSSGSERVLPFYGAVSAAKASLEAYCRQLAFELGGRGITVNAIMAGVTDTAALQKIPGSNQILTSASSRNPKGRLTREEDVADTIAMMAQQESAWINGATIRVDGGESIVDQDWTRMTSK